MPLMYFFAAVCCFLSYWTDKYLFLRLHRIPPLYGLELASGCQRIMEYSIILHLLVGVYMISNPDVFSFNDADKVKWSLLISYGELVSKWFETIIGSDADRFKQLHTIIFLIGILIFLVCFILERVFGLFSRLVSMFCCCIYRQEKHNMNIGFSNNFLAEMDIDDLLHEYRMNKVRIDEHSAYLNAEFEAAQNKSANQEVAKTSPDRPSSEHLHRYFLQRLKLKHKHIKMQLMQHMIKSNKAPAEKTEENFFKMQIETRGLKVGRIKTLYSYNIFDHPDYMQSQKIEKRIKKYNKKQLLRKMIEQKVAEQEEEEEEEQK